MYGRFKNSRKGTYSRVERAVKVHPISSRPVTIGKLDGAHLPHKDSTLINETLNSRACGIARSIQGIVCTVSATRSQSFDVVYVLYSEPKLLRIQY